MPDLVLVSLLSVMRAKPWAKRPIHMYLFFQIIYIYVNLYGDLSSFKTIFERHIPLRLHQINSH